MANAYAVNYALNSANNAFSAIWKWTRTMKAAGWNVVAVSDGATKRTLTTGTPASNANDFWGSNSDPLVDTYPSFDATPAWIVLRGPSTIKLEFTTAPGDLLRGEGVTQATSGATGELLGLVWDAGLSQGWAVIMPRTGTFNNSNIVTGDVSLETFTPTSYKEYVREVMIAKNSANTTTGTMYYICADLSAESASLFSTLADSDGSTATVPPAAGNTGNTFPSIAMCLKGTAGSVSHVNWFYDSTNFNTYAQAMAVNATPAAGVSADGSSWVTTAMTSAGNGQHVIGFCRVDDQEPGDIDPYVWFGTGNPTKTTYTNNTTVTAISANTLPIAAMLSSTGASLANLGYLSRGGHATRDKAVAFYWTISLVTYTNSGIETRIANYPGVSGDCPYLRDYPMLVSNRITEQWYKGRFRWLFVCSNGNHLDTFDTQRFLVVLAKSGSTNPAIAIGPYDGSSTPLAS
jgi:hypothetical protein